MSLYMVPAAARATLAARLLLVNQVLLPPRSFFPHVAPAILSAGMGEGWLGRAKSVRDWCGTHIGGGWHSGTRHGSRRLVRLR